MEKELTRGRCSICGCTNQKACYDSNYGSCWWANKEETLCSHCAPIENEDSLEYLKLQEA